MVKAGGRHPLHRCVAGIAGRTDSRGKVGTGFAGNRALGCGPRAVVAGQAGARNGGVVKSNSRPIRRNMTGITGVRRRKMGRRLARHLGVIVAGEAGAGCLGMIEIGWHPGCGRMTAIAGVRGCQVGARLAGGLGFVVAGEAGARGRRVIEGNGRPACGDMAILAHIGGGQVIRGLAHGGWACARMAGEAAADGRGMVEVLRGNRLPCGKADVAIVAGVGGSKMRLVLAGGVGTIVAREAGARRYGTMIEARGQPGRGALVAIRTDV